MLQKAFRCQVSNWGNEHDSVNNKLGLHILLESHRKWDSCMEGKEAAVSPQPEEAGAIPGR